MKNFLNSKYETDNAYKSTLDISRGYPYPPAHYRMVTPEEAKRTAGWIDDCIKKVIFNNPATIVFWKDGTKTVVKCQKGDTFDLEKGLAMAICKKVMGNKSNFNNQFKRIFNL